MTKLLTITVARKPLSESSVAKNVLKHGTGGLNIGASRISSVEPVTINTWDDGSKPFGGGAGHPFTGRQSTEGRWPANLILQHKSGCERAGTKKVKPSNGSGRAGPGGHGFQDAYVGGGKVRDGFMGGQVGDDGTETVDAWTCVEGCPVAELDEQSGAVRSAGDYPSESTRSENYIYSDRKGQQGPLYADKGGASRFFKQVQDD